VEMGKDRVFHSSDDVEKYWKMVYYIVNLSKYVHRQDKLDVAHNALIKLVKANKLINVRYISKTVMGIISVYRRSNIRQIRIKEKGNEVLRGQMSNQDDFAEFDFDSLPITEAEHIEIQRLMGENNSDIAREEGVGRSAIAMRKRRLVDKIKDRIPTDDTV
jgi:hypothetical protein